MGKRSAERDSFEGNMSSIQREDTAFYAKRRHASHDNGTRTNSSERYSDHAWPCHIGESRHSLCCEPLLEERSAGNPHATFCGNRRWATAAGDPDVGVKAPCATYPTHIFQRV